MKLARLRLKNEATEDFPALIPMACKVAAREWGSFDMRRDEKNDDIVFTPKHCEIVRITPWGEEAA